MIIDQAVTPKTPRVKKQNSVEINRSAVQTPKLKKQLTRPTQVSDVKKKSTTPALRADNSVNLSFESGTSK